VFALTEPAFLPPEEQGQIKQKQVCFFQNKKTFKARVFFSEVAAVINSRPVIRTGPGVPPGLGLRPLGTGCPKPAISFRSLRGIARQAITTTTNYNNFAAARLTSST